MIRLENIGKHFGNNNWGVKNIDLHIEEGEAVAVLGLSGSGKTTLFDIIGTLSKPTHGTYFLQGKDVSKLNEKNIAHLRRNTIGYIFQSFNLIHNWTVHKNLLIALKYQKKKSEQELMTALESIGLDGKLYAKVNTLSGGEQQRVSILRTFLRNPQLILADEPTGNLDSKNASLVMDMLFGLWKQGKTLIMITHNEDIAKLFPRIIRIHQGSIEHD